MFNDAIEKIDRKIDQLKYTRDDADAKIRQLQERKRLMSANAILSAAQENNMNTDDIIRMIAEREKAKPGNEKQGVTADEGQK